MRPHAPACMHVRKLQRLKLAEECMLLCIVYVNCTPTPPTSRSARARGPRQACLKLAEECRLLALEAAVEAGCPSDAPTAPAYGRAPPPPLQQARAPSAGFEDEEGEQIVSETEEAAAQSQEEGGAAAQAPEAPVPAEAGRSSYLEGGAAAAAAVAPAAAGLGAGDVRRLQGYADWLHAHVARLLDGATAGTLFRCGLGGGLQCALHTRLETQLAITAAYAQARTRVHTCARNHVT